MDNLNYIFFEEYKRLDKLCGQLYGDQHGVSHYIDDMKDVPKNSYLHISNWKTDLEQLIRLRHIRNYLAHTEGAFNEEICTQRDIEWSQNFYKRILNQSDPIATLYQYFEEKQRAVESRVSYSQLNIADEEVRKIDPKKGKKMKESYWIIFLLAMVGTLILVMFTIAALVR